MPRPVIWLIAEMSEETSTYMRVQRLCHRTPDFPQILFSILGKQGGERRFFFERAGEVFLWFERFDFPLVGVQYVLAEVKCLRTLEHSK